MLIRYRIVKAKYDDISAKLRRRCGKNVKIPNLINPQGTAYTILGLSFVFFGENVGKVVNKSDLLQFLRRHGCKTSDPQPRHLGMQYGLDFLIMGSLHPKTKRKLRAGEYCLKTLSSSHPSVFSLHHRRVVNLNAVTFNALKKKYAYRCACCGSLEGHPNYKNLRVITTLEKGHMDPRKELSVHNCIPVCGICNKVYKNKYLFNARGFVKPLK